MADHSVPIKDPMVVIAASLALPLVEREIKELNSDRPTGNSKSSNLTNRTITDQIQLLRRHRRALLDLVLGAG